MFDPHIRHGLNDLNTLHQGRGAPAFPHVGQVVNLRPIVNRPAAVVIRVHLWPKIFYNPAIASISTFPPDTTIPTRDPPALPHITAAPATAPLGSTTIFIRLKQNRIISRISSSLTNTISSTNFSTIGNVIAPGFGDRKPSAI